jgi:colicin import membrane protein
MTADKFSRNLMISGFGHIAVVLIIFFRAVTMPNEHLELRNAIRVDMVGLPQKMEALPEKVAEKPAPAPAVKEMPKKVQVEPVKPKAPEVPVKKKEVDHAKNEKRAMEKLKAMEALEKISQEVGREKTAKPKATVVAGNKLAAGNSLTGLEKIEYDQYFDELEKKIHGAWSIPQWLADIDLKAQVLVLIDDKGDVLRKTFKKSSGNEIFDAKVLEAIDASSPLPPPPARLRGLLSTSGIVFNFPQ